MQFQIAAKQSVICCHLANKNEEDSPQRFRLLPNYSGPCCTVYRTTNWRRSIVRHRARTTWKRQVCTRQCLLPARTPSWGGALDSRKSPIRSSVYAKLSPISGKTSISGQRWDMVLLYDPLPRYDTIRYDTLFALKNW